MLQFMLRTTKCFPILSIQHLVSISIQHSDLLNGGVLQIYMIPYKQLFIYYEVFNDLKHQFLGLFSAKDRQKFPCNQCDKIFKTKPGLHFHQEKHETSTGAKHVCEKCGAKFAYKVNLTEHLR